MTPAEFRARVAAVLEPLSEDWSTHAGPVDAISPPAFVCTWADPWLVPLAVCSYTARLAVICAAARLDPEPGYEQLEQMIAAALPALQAAGIPFVQLAGVAPFECGALQYQAARLICASPITLDQEITP
ncbi:MAG TPA: hypothetical protein VKB59_22710, partial [Micromonosporaceae bacterium]|nr:hypothetical protein [Micromonosporaceae bacterium]